MRISHIGYWFSKSWVFFVAATLVAFLVRLHRWSISYNLVRVYRFYKTLVWVHLYLLSGTAELDVTCRLSLTSTLDPQCP